MRAHRPSPMPAPSPRPPPTASRAPTQRIRLNSIADERARKLKAGEPVPTLISEDAKAGRLDVPFTNAGKK